MILLYLLLATEGLSRTEPFLDFSDDLFFWQIFFVQSRMRLWLVYWDNCILLKEELIYAFLVDRQFNNLIIILTEYTLKPSYKSVSLVHQHPLKLLYVLSQLIQSILTQSSRNIWTIKHYLIACLELLLTLFDFGNCHLLFLKWFILFRSEYFV